MPLIVNLEKSTQALVMTLEKAGITQSPKLEVGFAMDVSGSFEDEHTSGVTNLLLTRLVPWGLTFDPDKKMDCFTFSNGEDHVVDIGPVDVTNYEGFVKAKICESIAGQVVPKVKGFNGGTDYSFVLEKLLCHFGWLAVEKKPGFIGRMFGAQSTVTQNEPRRSLIIVATDGDNQDKDRTRRILHESQTRKDEVYFLFIGISNQGSRFPFLESIGDEFDNTGFVSIKNLREFVEKSDDELNEMLIDEELLAWLKR